MENKKKQRIEFIDMAKGWAMLLVMFFHVRLDVVEANASNDWFLIVAGTYVMPLMFLLSGMCYKHNPSFLQYLKRKARGYLVPYFFFGALLVIAYLVGLGMNKEMLLFAVSSMLLQQRFTTLWFLAALFFTVLIFWVVVAVSKDNIKVILVVSTIISLLGVFYSEYTRQPMYWNIDTSLVVQIFFAAGYALKKNGFAIRIQEMTTGKKLILALILMIVQGVLAYANRALGYEDFQMFYMQYGNVVLNFASAFAGAFAVMFFSSAFTLKFVNYVGRCSLTFFALHQTIFIETMYIIYRALGIDYTVVDDMFILRRCITYAFVVIGCTIVDQLLRHSKLKFVVGA